MKIDDVPFGFGGAPLGNLFAPVGDDVAVELVRGARARGIRYFDTAPHYGNGLSEHRIGAALRDAPRDEFLLSTKVGRLLVPDPHAPVDQHGYVGVLPFVQRWDYSYAGTLRSVEDSLQRLALARIDYVFIHDVARDAHGDAAPQRFREAMEGAVPALARLKSEGAIAGYGLGVNDWQVCVDALAHAEPDVLLLAGRYTLLDQTALPELLPKCVGRGVRVIVGGPFNSGILATGPRPADGTEPRFDYEAAPAAVVARAAAIDDVCRAHGVDLKAAALQFPRAHPAVACVLPGARSVAELEENLALSHVSIPGAFWRALRDRALVAADAPLPPGDRPVNPARGGERGPGNGLVDAARAGAPTALRVDAHHHVWQLARGDYAWLTPAFAPIHRDFSLDDLRPLLRAADIGATVLVQAAPTDAETAFLLATAKASEGLVRGVVGWVDRARPGAVDRLAALARDPLLKSVRPMLQDLPDPDWILRPEVRPALAALPGLRLRFDALVTPAQLPALLALLERHPDLAVVIDHGGKPPIAAGGWEPWAGLMAALAGHPLVHCKLSGLVTEAGPAWRVASLARYVEHLLACFGASRLLWGSDWPVVNLTGDYAGWVAATDALLAGLSRSEREAIRGGNARRFYGLA